jgi:PAS domain S-box-containing protein
MLEITETVVMSDPETAIRRLDDLRLLGVRLAVDDFGTGHSSLAYLRRLPVQELKLARQFVSDLDRTPESLALARGIVGLAHAMGMRVIAEGVEQPAERDRLRGMGCDLAQGYLFARPVRADALAPLLLAGARERRIPPDTADGRRTAATTGASAFEDLRARYQAVLAQLPELVVMAFDTELRWRSVEGQALERLGWQATELQGRHPREVLPAEHAHRLEALLRAALRGERRTTTWTTARGSAPFAIDLRPLRDPHGAVSGVVLVGRDRRAQAGG